MSGGTGYDDEPKGLVFWLTIDNYPIDNYPSSIWAA